MSLPQGLTLVPDFVDPSQEVAILTWLDQQPWDTSLKRRTQHYGYRYNYAGHGHAPLVPTTPFSGPILEMAQRLSTTVYSGGVPTQCIVNEYTRNQGIAAHTDSPMFGPTIVSISLGAPTIMIFSHRDGTRIPVPLPQRSLLIMTGPARTEWKHEISPNVRLIYPDGHTETKPGNYRRVSLTYRTV